MMIRKMVAGSLLCVGVLWGTPVRAAVLTGIDPTVVNVGSGVDISYLVIDDSTLYSTPLEFVYHYTYDSNNPLTGFTLLQSVANIPAAGFSAATTFYGGGLGNSLDSLTYGGTTVASSNAPDFSSGTYWSYYVAGGLDGGVAPTIPNQWNYANNGMDSRTVTPGSWDGWTLSSYSDYGNTTTGSPPSVAIAAVPEPKTAPLLLLSLAAWIFFTRCNAFGPKKTF